MFVRFKDAGRHFCAGVVKTGGWNTGDDETRNEKEKWSVVEEYKLERRWG
jgi:hypothetical protein